MITESDMSALAKEAEEHFPIAPERLMYATLTGDRSVLQAAVRQRILWMLNMAYDRAKSE